MALSWESSSQIREALGKLTKRKAVVCPLERTVEGADRRERGAGASRLGRFWRGDAAVLCFDVLTLSAYGLTVRKSKCLRPRTECPF